MSNVIYPVSSETISELVRKQKENQAKKEVAETKNIPEAKSVLKEDTMDTEDNNKGTNIIPNPLTPPTPDPLSKDKTHIKLENLPVSSCGMLDRTRVALFAFMFAFIFVNPLSYLFPQLDKGSRSELCIYKVVKFIFLYSREAGKLVR